MKHFKMASLIASSGAALMLGAPAFAEKPAAPVASSQESGTAAPKATATPRTKYCAKMEASTGSRVSRRACRTKEEWESLGVDTSSFK